MQPKAMNRVAVRFINVWTIEVDGVLVWLDRYNQGEDYARNLAREYERLPAVALDAEVTRAHAIAAFEAKGK